MARAVVVSVGVEPDGVPPGVVHAAGGPAQLLALLDAQLARRRDRRVPTVDDDPAWVVSLPEEETMRRAAEALGTLANGWAGLRAAREEDGPGTLPSFAVNGIYTAGPAPSLLSGPIWTALTVSGAGRDERLLDLRTGVLLRTGRDGSPLRTLRFVSAADPWFMALRAEGSASQLESGTTFGAPADGTPMELTDRGPARLARTTDPEVGGITVAVQDSQHDGGDHRVVERLGAWVADGSRPPDWEQAAARLAEAERLGFDRLLAEHREAWAHRWADAEIRIEGGAEDELAARFATFHLLAAAPDTGEAAVGARPDRARVRRSRVLGCRCVRPACARRHPTRRGAGHARVPHTSAARSSGCGRGRRSARRPVPVGVRR